MFVSWAIAILIFLLIVLSNLYFSNQELQAKIKDFFFRTEKDYHIWDTTEQSDHLEKTQKKAEAWLEQTPNYIPEGYELIEQLESFSSKFYLYENKDKKILSIGISLADDPNGELYAFDREHSIERQIEQDGIWFTFFEAVHPEDGNLSFLFYKFPEGGGYLYLSGVLE